MSVAYTTRAGLDSSNVGSVAAGDESFELHEELDKGNGFVIVDDDNTLLQVILDAHDALKRTTLKAAEEAAAEAEKKAARSEAAQKAAETRKTNEGQAPREALERPTPPLAPGEESGRAAKAETDRSTDECNF